MSMSMNKYSINIDGRLYDGYYSSMTSAVFGAMRFDEYDKDKIREPKRKFDRGVYNYSEMAILCTLVESNVTRTTSMCKRVKLEAKK